VSEPLRIDVWSDIACPWCYIGKRHLEHALASIPDAPVVDLVWHAFELDPSAPVTREAIPNAQRLADKYGVSVERAEAMMDRVIGVGAKAGLELQLRSSKAGNTFDAHRLLRWAHELGKQGELKERLMRAYQCEGVVISDRDELVRLAGDVGLDRDEARRVLDSEQFAAEVRADEQLAHELGVTGVPFFVFAQKYGVSGAQPVDVLREVIAKAIRER